MATEVMIDPGVTPDPPLAIRIIPAPALWADVRVGADPVHIVNWRSLNPVMHRLDNVFAYTDGSGYQFVMVCGARSKDPSVVRYDHARRFARHCQRCTRRRSE